MDDKTSARQKDEILKYLIEEYILDKGTAFGTKELVRVIFKNVINEQKVTDLCEEIITEDSDLLYKVTNFSSAKYRATDKTSEFLSNHGGFTSRNKEKEDKELDEKSKEGERRELQDEINALQKKNLGLKTKTHWVPIGISIASLLLVIFKPVKEVSNEIENDKFNLIESKLEVLEKGMKVENDSLKALLVKVNSINTDTIK